MQLSVDPHIRTDFPGLGTLIFEVKGVKVQAKDEILENFKIEAVARARATYDLEALKDLPSFRAYRDFFWRVGIDPTKTRPASEALLRRVLQGKELPRINTLVDVYNIASMETHVPLAVFDKDKLEGILRMRRGQAGERFLGIGMKEDETLTGKEVVVVDNHRLVAIYPYRDADYSKVTLDTENICVLVCGVPEIASENLENSKRIAEDYITRFCGGELYR